MAVAVIDLGTNTFNITIAETETREVLYNEKRAVRLGMGGISKGYITDEAIQRAVDALLHYRSRIGEFEVHNTLVTATSAVRNASNKNEFLAEIKEKTGFEIKVISGEKEANLIYQGVSSFLNFDENAELIIDIGGGSIEFIIADDVEPKWIRSLEIGGQRLMDKFHKTDPITAENISELNLFLNDQLNEVLKQCQQHNVTKLIGSAGSFDTLRDMYIQSDWNKQNNETTELPIDYFKWICGQFINLNREERLRIPGMIAMRVDMIVVASLVVNFLIDQLHIKSIRVSEFALKEGLLFSEKGIKILEE